jgi:hypothetical protein
MLTRYSGALVLAVALGVGVAAVLGMLRFLLNWSLKPLILSLVPVLAILSVWAYSVPDLSHVIGLAWDTGAVTTGPVTVPLVLALGIGVCRVTGKSDSGMAGFGIITLASLLPIIAVLGLAFALHYGGASVDASGLVAGEAAGLDLETLADAAASAARAVLPLCAFLFLVLLFLLRERLRHPDEVFLGVAFALIGMTLFVSGLNLGLSPLGNQVGSAVPAAFSEIQAGVPPEPTGPLYGNAPGKVIAILFAFFLGFGATLAEPALKALGIEVEEITVGALKKGFLIRAVALGVGLGVALGVVNIAFGVPLIYLLLPPYALLLVLSVASTEEMVNIAWDSAGVTTGPVTVPLVIAMGLGLGNTLPGVVEGFGILAMASVCPILALLVVGLYATWAARAARRRRALPNLPLFREEGGHGP